MKKAALFIFISVMALQSQAQHCPFDGAHLIAIKVVDKQGRMMQHFNSPLYLVEVDNPMADSCEQAAGLLKKQLQNTEAFIADCNERYGRNGYNKQLKDRLTKAGVFANANMMIILNQAENTCTLVGPSETVYTNYIYRQRKFVIAYTLNGKAMQQAVPANHIYPLCTNNKDLGTFSAITIRL